MSPSKKTALISVSDRNGLLPFAQKLVSQGWDILATTSTMEYLSSAGITCRSVSDLTNFPELLGAR